MLFTIDFHEQSLLKGDEINSIWADGLLPSEPRSLNLAVSKLVPQGLFSVGPLAAKVPGAGRVLARSSLIGAPIGVGRSPSL